MTNSVEYSTTETPINTVIEDKVIPLPTHKSSNNPHINDSVCNNVSIEQLQSELIQARNLAGEAEQNEEIAKEDKQAATKARTSLNQQITAFKSEGRGLNKDSSEFKTHQEKLKFLSSQLTEASKLEAIKSAEYSDALKSSQLAKRGVSSATASRNDVQMMFPSKIPDSLLRDYIVESGAIKTFSRTEKDGNSYAYKEGTWQLIERESLEYKFDIHILAKIIEDGYMDSRVKSFTNMCARSFRVLPEKKAGVKGFNNCAIEISNCGKINILEHSPELGLLNKANFDFNQTQLNCPYFEQWLGFISKKPTDEETNERMELVLAVLYMVMFNRYDWQMFAEIIGAGDNGKSIFTHVCKILAGGSCNVASMGLAEIEGKKGGDFTLESIIGKSLIIVPDAEKIASDFNTLKNITGNDPICINRKNKARVDLPFVPTTVVITGNQPLVSTDQSSGLFRRRVTFYLGNVVTEDMKIIGLENYLEKESSAIINIVANFFKSPEQARLVLKKATTSKDKLKAMTETDPLAEWVSTSLLPLKSSKIQVGGSASYKKSKEQKTKRDYFNAIGHEIENKLFSNYLHYCEFAGLKHPLSQKNFSKNLEAMFQKMKTNGFGGVTIITANGAKWFKGVEINHFSEHMALHKQDMIENCNFEDVKIKSKN